MKGKELKKKYLKFFESKGHAVIKSAPLIPEHDPTVLFTTAGMHPLVPFLMGEKHLLGNRLVDVQKCIRTQDIDEVGDENHTTFFEMLGNWSLGDYFKKEAIEWSFEFLTSKKWLGLDINRIAVSCFAGDDDAPKDEEAADFWKNLGIPEKRIAFLPKSDNWWGPAGETGPCGPDTEMFYWISDDKPPEKFDPEDKRWVEIWNDVFMQYNKVGDGKFEELSQKNVDTGLGVERVAMALQGKKTVFDTELFQPIFEKVALLSGVKPSDKNIKSFRIISDHIRASTFILGDERKVPPSNLDQGYILRRFIRRALRHARLIGVPQDANLLVELAKLIIKMYKDEYPELKENKGFIIDEMQKEQDKFEATLEKGLKEFPKMGKDGIITGKEAFLLFQSYGFPLEMTEELATEKGIKVDGESFQEEFKQHQELSRKGAEKKFKGGLSESSEDTKRLHTATHLLNEALRRVLKEDIRQRGSNITPERLRFDFNFDRKLTPGEKKEVEDIINKVISDGLSIERMEMTVAEAKKKGAQAEFEDKYGEKVSVYKIGDFSFEICGGPHVDNTKELGHFRIKKEESSAAGIRRIKAVLE